ncbi:hypothetical protein PoB_005459600 [Plakobranchus ocellatus]|uniref:Uncharacterized protein n=1 Tax=Plakobranchus ocellatus TaxID=259542 RepID=A0AAV4BY61_9GAST|nr:hypothetical protein PoB_005459600 [Plakobranchus ocellatus]
MVSYRPSLLLVSVLMASSAAGEDTISVVLRPPYRPGFPVIVRCHFEYIGSEIETLASLKLERSVGGYPPNYRSVATVTPDDEINEIGGQATVVGEIDPGYEAFVSVRFPDANAYCFNYKCTATGRNKQGQSKSIEHTERSPCA